MAGSVLMLLAILGSERPPQPADRQLPASTCWLYELSIPVEHPVLVFPFVSRVLHQGAVFPFHTWLPDAHVQAPTAVLGHPRGRAAEDGHLRLVRFAFPLFPEAAAYFAPYIGPRFAVIGIIYGAPRRDDSADMKKSSPTERQPPWFRGAPVSRR